ncbi:hypothetical protein M8Z33_26485 [Streptomyces sp. ZAF1911]|uniref:hypothetical protein n=1 Tax=Streptomyces sp. ZAF1911 TaxID=2944129 RepID=UPI00237BF35D|nr:hypothetical protein [Streptomyces sp. ZAF1911]MDD9380140.1 hypothetical protein [Streptomyces sp. ZAF1911]
MRKTQKVQNTQSAKKVQKAAIRRIRSGVHTRMPPVSPVRAGYQVKLLVDPDRVLDADGLPTAAAAAALSLGAPRRFEVAQYMDDARRSLNGQGWIVRIRRHDDENRIRLAYKARFDIEGDGTDPAAVRRVMDRASGHNFCADDGNYSVQVNLSHTRATLDFTNKKCRPVPGLEPGELPGLDASRALVLERLPGKLAKWAAKPAGWAESVTASSRLHGPVRQANYPGRMLDHAMETQVSRLRTASGELAWFAEITAKGRTLRDAVELRSDLMGKLRAEGWLLERDAFKTELILGP